MHNQNEEPNLGPVLLWGLWFVLLFLLWMMPVDSDITFGERMILTPVMAGLGVMFFSAAPLGITLILFSVFLMGVFKAAFGEVWAWVHMLLVLGLMIGLLVAAEELKHLNVRLWRMRWSSRSSTERLMGQRFNGIGPNRWDK